MQRAEKYFTESEYLNFDGGKVVDTINAQRFEIPKKLKINFQTINIIVANLEHTLRHIPFKNRDDLEAAVDRAISPQGDDITISANLSDEERQRIRDYIMGEVNKQFE